MSELLALMEKNWDALPLQFLLHYCALKVSVCVCGGREWGWLYFVKEWVLEKQELLTSSFQNGSVSADFSFTSVPRLKEGEGKCYIPGAHTVFQTIFQELDVGIWT